MSGRTPLYPRLLRLRHVHPNGWQRAALGEGALAVAGILVLADLATAWTLVVLPVAVAAVVKGHDLLAGVLARPGNGQAEPGAAEQVAAEHRTDGTVDRSGPARTGADGPERVGTDDR